MKLFYTHYHYIITPLSQILHNMSLNLQMPKNKQHDGIVVYGDHRIMYSRYTKMCLIALISLQKSRRPQWRLCSCCRLSHGCQQFLLSNKHTYSVIHKHAVVLSLALLLLNCTHKAFLCLPLTNTHIYVYAKRKLTSLIKMIHIGILCETLMKTKNGRFHCHYRWEATLAEYGKLHII